MMLDLACGTAVVVTGALIWAMFECMDDNSRDREEARVGSAKRDWMAALNEAIILEAAVRIISADMDWDPDSLNSRLAVCMAQRTVGLAVLQKGGIARAEAVLDDVARIAGPLRQRYYDELARS